MWKKIFDNRTVAFYIGLVGAALALVTDIVFIIGDHADRTFSLLAFALAFIGALSYLAVCLFDCRYLILLSGGLFIGAFAVELNTALPSLSDVWNGVNFIGGNAAFGTTVAAVFLLAAICMIVVAFSGERKK